MKLRRSYTIVSEAQYQLVVDLVVRDKADQKTYGSARLTFVKPLVKATVTSLIQSAINTIMQGNLLEAIIDYENETSEWP